MYKASGSEVPPTVDCSTGTLKEVTVLDAVVGCTVLREMSTYHLGVVTSGMSESDDVPCLTDIP